MTTNTGDPRTPDRGEDAALDERFAETVAGLREAGAAWQAEQAALVERSERHARETLRASLVEGSQAETIAQLQAETQARQGQESRRRWRARLMQASALVALLALAVVGVARWRPSFEPNTGPQSRPAPAEFLRSPQAMAASQTAQQAFANGITLTPCIGGPGSTVSHGAPPRSVTITWLFNGANYGLARIQLVCDPAARPIPLWLFSMGRWPDRSWGIFGGGSFGGDGPGPQSVAPVPTWLPLPADPYDYWPVAEPEGVHPAVSAVAWSTQSRLFVFGHVADRAIRPAGATSVVVDGHAGWMATENGMTTVSAALADGTSLFFSGTATPAEVEALAGDAFAHADDALENLHYPTVTPSAVSGLGG